MKYKKEIIYNITVMLEALEEFSSFHAANVIYDELIYPLYDMISEGQKDCGKLLDIIDNSRSIASLKN